MVICADCGYLGVRHPGTHELVGPDEYQRQTGLPTRSAIPSVGSMGENVSDGETVLGIIPTCAVGAWSLERYYRGGNDNAARCCAAKEVIQRERDCSKFTPWIPGLTPKEHIDMLATREMLDAQANRLDAQAAREREWRKEDMKLASDNLKTARGNTTAQWWIMAIALIVGAGGLGLSIWNTFHPQAPIPTVTAPTNPGNAR